MTRKTYTSKLNARIGRQFPVAGRTPQDTTNPPRCIRRCLRRLEVANTSPRAMLEMARALDEWYEVEDWEDHSNGSKSCS